MVKTTVENSALLSNYSLFPCMLATLCICYDYISETSF